MTGSSESCYATVMEDSGTKMSMQYTLTTVDGEFIVGYASDELEALDNAKKWYPDDFIIDVKLTQVRMVKNP